MLGFLRYGPIWLISPSGCLGHHNEGVVLYPIKFRAGGRGQGQGKGESTGDKNLTHHISMLDPQHL